jgi:hypothetical protein
LVSVERLLNTSQNGLSLPHAWYEDSEQDAPSDGEDVLLWFSISSSPRMSLDVLQIKKTNLMKPNPYIFLAVFAWSTLANADIPESFKSHVLFDMTRALKMDTPVSELDSSRREVAIKEALALIDLNPNALAEFEALEQDDAKGTPVSAIILQEIISDYEVLKIESPVSPLISYYIARSKVEVLSQRRRVIAFLLIKSATRQYNAKKKWRSRTRRSIRRRQASSLIFRLPSPRGWAKTFGRKYEDNTTIFTHLFGSSAKSVGEFRFGKFS